MRNFNRAELLAMLSIDMYAATSSNKKAMKKLHKKLSHGNWEIYYDNGTLVYSSENEKWQMRVQSSQKRTWALVSYIFSKQDLNVYSLMWDNDEIEDLCI